MLLLLLLLLQVRCRRVLPLLRAALAAADFSLTRKLLHFFWAFFPCRGRGDRSHRCNGNQHLKQDKRCLDSSAAAAAATESQMPQQRRQLRQTRRQQRKTRRQHQLRETQQNELQQLLWRPLQQDMELKAPVTTAATEAAEPWLSCVPSELSTQQRLQAARVYRDVEAAVAAVAVACLQQQQWLRLFEFATALALDLPAWLRGCSDLTTSTAHKLQQQQRRDSAQGEPGIPTVAPAFFATVSSFLLQLPVGPGPVCLRLRRHRVADTRAFVHRKQQPQPSCPLSERLKSAALTALKSSVRQQLPLLSSNEFKQQQVAAEIARYLANVLLLSGLPMHTLALAVAVRDSTAAAQILQWYPEVRACFLAVTADSVRSGDEAEVRQWIARAAKES